MARHIQYLFIVLLAFFSHGWTDELQMAMVPDPVIFTRADEIHLSEISSDKTRKMIFDMKEYATHLREEKQFSLIGLSAPEVGIDKRIILIDTAYNGDEKKLGPLKAYINPQIIWYSNEIEEDKECCLCVDQHISGVIVRSKHIKIIAFDALGRTICEELSGMPARAFQHAVDHLEGICFPERVHGQHNLHWVDEELFALYQTHWKTWPISCSWSVWLAMKLDMPYYYLLPQSYPVDLLLNFYDQ